MGIIKRLRGERQEDAIEPDNVWIEDPDGTGQLILVKKTDLDERGFLKDRQTEVEGDATS